MQKPLRAKSKIGSESCRLLIGRNDLLIALRAHLDSSGKLENKYMTLAAVASTDDIWASFETEWDKILKGHTPKADYAHMREIAHQIKGFDRKKGWNDDNAFGLSTKCLMYMQTLDKKRFRILYCAVDLEARRRLVENRYPIPEPVEMCNRWCSEAVIYWYSQHFPDKIDLLHDKIRYFFDRNEYFKDPFEEKWNRERDLSERLGKWTPWNLIEQVSAVDMKTLPGIQAADMVAWAVNRENIVEYGKKAKHMAHVIRQVLPSLYIEWDEATMKKHFRPVKYPS